MMFKPGALCRLSSGIPVWESQQDMLWDTPPHWIPKDSLVSILEIKEGHFIIHTHLGIFNALESWMKPSRVERVR